MVAQERRPGLPATPRRARLAYVLLDRALADPHAEPEQLSADALGAPEAILAGQLLNQGRDLRGHASPG
jgi:hypothetical protein